MTTKEKIRQFVVANFYVADPSQLQDDASLLAEGAIDSTGVLEVIAYIEKEFGVAVQDDEILPDHFDGIARIASFVDRKLSSGTLGTGGVDA